MSENRENDNVTRVVKCPSCRKPVVWGPASAFKPFCSDRCRLLDLGAWASEKYAIPSATPPDLDEFDTSQN